MVERMVFFSTDNPVVLLLAGVIAFLVLRAVLAKVLGKTEFGQKHSDFVSAIITLLGLIMVTSIGFLKMVAHSVPYLTVTFMLIVLVIGIFLAMGVRQQRIKEGLNVFTKNVYLWILLVLIIVWGASIIMGPDLLEKHGKEESTTFTGFTAAEQENVDNFDFGFIFTKPLLGFALVFLVLGLTFYTITKMNTAG